MFLRCLLQGRASTSFHSQSRTKVPRLTVCPLSCGSKSGTSLLCVLLWLYSLFTSGWSLLLLPVEVPLSTVHLYVRVWVSSGWTRIFWSWGLVSAWPSCSGAFSDSLDVGVGESTQGRVWGVAWCDGAPVRRVGESTTMWRSIRVK